MKKVHLQGTIRKDLHKTTTKSLRKSGHLPAIFYGFESDNIACHIPMVDILPWLDTIKPFFIELTLEGNSYDCIINEVQYHPVNDLPLHIDLLQITNKRPIRLNIPIEFVGKAPGILKGGELAIKKRTIPVRALPKDMPEKLSVDISSLELGEKITVNAIPKGNYTILAQPQIPIANIIIPRALRSSKAAEKKE